MLEHFGASQVEKDLGVPVARLRVCWGAGREHAMHVKDSSDQHIALAGGHHLNRDDTD